MTRQQLESLLATVGKRTDGVWSWDGEHPEWLQSSTGKMVLRPDWDETNPDRPYSVRDAAAIVAAVNGVEEVGNMLREAMVALAAFADDVGNECYCGDLHMQSCLPCHTRALLEKWEGPCQSA